MPIPSKGAPDYVDHVLRTARDGLIRQGVINEPRMLFDEITVPRSTDMIGPGSPGTFINGEPWPLRITHVLAAMRHVDKDGVTPGIDLLTSLVGMRLMFHDQFFMNAQFVACSTWGNKATATPNPTDEGTAHWDFVANAQPFVLSARDTLIVSVALQVAPAAGQSIPVTVTFMGIGSLSRRPYMLQGTRDVTSLAPIDLSTVDFRNDGLEPIVITDMQVQVAGETRTAGITPQGVLSNLRLNIKQVGNGTNTWWFAGPTAPINQQRAQASLVGVTTGRAVVCQLPGDGFIWEPGEGMTIEVQPRTTLQIDPVLCVGLTGYIMVT
jgi:hypothetical protein